MMGKDPEQLMDWVICRNKPIERNRQIILKFLDGHGKKRGIDEGLSFFFSRLYVLLSHLLYKARNLHNTFKADRRDFLVKFHVKR